MDEAENHHSQQTDTRTENQTQHVFTYKWELNYENTRTHRGDLHTWACWRVEVGGGRGSGKMTRFNN